MYQHGHTAIITGVESISMHRYRNGQEFYRYIPTDTPDTTVFPYPGIYVDVSCKFFCQILRNIWIGSEISVFSGVPVLRDENNLTESRSCHHWDVQVMNNSIFHHSQTSNTGYPQKSTLLEISLMLMLLSEFSQ